MQVDPARDIEKLEDMVQAGADVMGFCADLSPESFASDKKSQYAVIRGLTVLGEAANQLSPELTEKYPGVPWRRVIGFRHRLVHAYAQLDLTLIWEVATRMVPELVVEIRRILAAEGERRGSE